MISPNLLGTARPLYASTSGALLAGVYQANAEDGVVGSRRCPMNRLAGDVMDGLIAGHLVETTVCCTPISAGPDLYAGATGEGGGMNDQHGISGSLTLLSVVNAGEEGLGHGVALTRRVELGR